MNKEIQEQFYQRIKEVFKNNPSLNNFGIKDDNVLINSSQAYLWHPFEQTVEGKSWLVEVGITQKTYLEVRSIVLHYLNNLTDFPEPEVWFNKEDFV